MNHIPFDIKLIICSYIMEPVYKMRDFIDPERIRSMMEMNPSPGMIEILKNMDFSDILWEVLCRNTNPDAMKMIEYQLQTNYDNIKNRLDIEELCSNPNAINIIKEHPDWIDMECLAMNHSPLAMDMMKEYLDNNDDPDVWYNLSKNPFAVDILFENMSKVHIPYLSQNPHPRVIDYLSVNPSYIDWYFLSAMPEAIDIIRKHIAEGGEKIVWKQLCRNPAAIDILEQNILHSGGDMICWASLSSNINGTQLLRKYFKKDEDANLYTPINDSVYHINYEVFKNIKIHWPNLSTNTSPDAMKLIEENPERLDKSAIRKIVIDNYPSPNFYIESVMTNHKIRHVVNMEALSQNPAIFIIDTKATDIKIREFVSSLF